jgi:uncharacterized membrane protein
MAVLAVLIIAWLAFRALGGFGMARFNGWIKSLPYALAVMFAFTGVAHFNAMRHDMVRMVPSWVPYPEQMVFATGILEFMGAAGLIWSKTRKLAAICLVLFLIAVFPANVNAAQKNVTLGGRPATSLYLRAPMQLLFIGLLLVVAMKSPRD